MGCAVAIACSSVGTEMVLGKPVEEAAKVAVLAGTLQFHKLGIQPVTKDELEAASSPT